MTNAPGLERWGTVILVADGEKPIRPWPEVIRLLKRSMPMAADEIKVQILRDRGTNPLDPYTSGEVKLHNHNIGDVLTLSRSKAAFYVENGWARYA